MKNKKVNNSNIALCGLISSKWSNSLYYYKSINEQIEKILGKLNSSTLIIYSLNYEECGNSQEKYKELLADAALRVYEGGAEFLVLCANNDYEAVDNIKILIREKHNKAFPILHIADAVAYELRTKYLNVKRLGLVGSMYFMTGEIPARLKDHDYDICTIEEENINNILILIKKEVKENITKAHSLEVKLIEIVTKLSNSVGCFISGSIGMTTFLRRHLTNITILDATTIHSQTVVKVQLRELTIIGITSSKIILNYTDMMKEIKYISSFQIEESKLNRNFIT